MKTIKMMMALVAVVMMTACGGKQTKAVDSEATDTIENNRTAIAEASDTTWTTVINRYLTDSIGSHYAEGEHCVPAYSIVAADESRSDDILVWGDFWVFHYNQVGDTLKCVSGGSHPGLMHIRRTDKGFAVTNFDCVEDGSGNIPSAKRIFGEKYEAFHAINSDADKREVVRHDMLAAYVSKHGLSATMYQDYGWPAKPLNK